MNAFTYTALILDKAPALLSAQTLLVAFVLVLTLWLYHLSSTKSRKRIPGPFRLPIVGSISVLPAFLSNIKRHKIRVALAKQYGDICVVYLGKMPMVLLNDMRLIKEAFVTKGDIISDRMPPSRNDMFAKRIGEGVGLGGISYGKDFRDRKALAQSAMREFGLAGKSLDYMIAEETRFLVQRMRKFADTHLPTKIHETVVYLAVSNVICSVVFGQRFSYDDEEFVATIQAIHHLFSKTSAVLMRLPFATHIPYVKRQLMEEYTLGGLIAEFLEKQMVTHRENFNDANPQDFVDLWLQTTKQDNDQISTITANDIKRIILDLFVAGTDTTASTLNWFLLYMIHYPEVQRRCQLEIDSAMALGAEVSQATAFEMFPFTSAALLEAQRMSSSAGASLPHIVREDTTVGGYPITKGSLVVANIQFLHRDERYWDEPDVYKPERWLDRDDNSKVVQHSAFVPFSIGRRRCPGESLAKTEYLLFGIHLLHNFVFKPVDPTNLPPFEGVGLIYQPFSFEMLMETRKY